MNRPKFTPNPLNIMTQYHGQRLKPLGVMAKSCFSCFRLYWNDHTWFIFIYFQTKQFPSKLLGLKWCPEARGSSHVKNFEFWNFHLLGAVPPLPDWLWQCHLIHCLGSRYGKSEENTPFQEKNENFNTRMEKMKKNHPELGLFFDLNACHLH